MYVNKAQDVTFFLKIQENFQSFIRRIVIYDDHFVLWIVLSQEIREVSPQVVFFVAGANNYGNGFGRAGWRIRLPVKGQPGEDEQPVNELYGRCGQKKKEERFLDQMGFLDSKLPVFSQMGRRRAINFSRSGLRRKRK